MLYALCRLVRNRETRRMAAATSLAVYRTGPFRRDSFGTPRPISTCCRTRFKLASIASQSTEKICSHATDESAASVAAESLSRVLAFSLDEAFARLSKRAPERRAKTALEGR